ncbi:AAA family ATPase [bacterium]|nr:AAA family ATPase [bacterium]
MKIEQIFLKNFLIIHQATISLDAGMSVVTGETGSGKSLFVSAMKLLRGERASHKIIGRWSKTAEISAVVALNKDEDEAVINELKRLSIFQADDFRTVIRRTIGDKGSAFINDTPVALTTLHLLMSSHLEISSQFENRELSKREYQISIVDREALSKLELPHYQELFHRWKAIISEIEKLKQQDDPGKRDFIEFQIEEIEKVDPTLNEEQELNEKLFLLENGQHISRLRNSLEKQLLEAETLLSSAQDDAEELVSLTKESELFERVESLAIEVSDLHRTVAISTSHDDDDDDEDVDAMRSRLDTLNNLFGKHRLKESGELLELLKNMNNEIRELYLIPDRVDKLTKEAKSLYITLEEEGDWLHEKRKTAAKTLSKTIETRLIELGMQGVQFAVSVEKREVCDEYGLSDIRFLVNTVGGSTLEPISTLSGGELSRLLLVLKLLDNDSGKIILFDEIDSNIGGETAAKAAQNLRKNAELNQIVVVTHLPQTAAKGRSHFVVRKSANETAITATISQLEESERIIELARMMGDAELSAHKNAAHALLER